MYPQNRLYVESLVFCRAANSIPEYERPFSIQPGVDAESLISETVRNRSVLDALESSLEASNVLRPVAEVNKNDLVHIPGGWGERRLRYSMIIDLDTANGSLRYILSGYTDQDDISHNGLLDPQMRFYINSVQVLKSMSSGSRRDYRPRGSYQLISKDLPGADQAPYDSPRRSLLSPNNVLYQIGSMMSHHQGQYKEASLIDSRNLSATGRNLVSRGHTLPGRYVADMVNGLVASIKQQDQRRDRRADILPNYRSDDWHTLYGQAATLANMHGDSVKDSRNDLFKIFQQEGILASDGSVSYSNLCGVAPNLEDLNTPVLRGDDFVLREVSEETRDVAFGESDCRDWHGRDIYTVMASMLKSTISALMSESQLRRMTVVMTNQTISGHDDVVVRDAFAMFNNLDERSLVDIFVRRAICEVCPILSERGMRDYYVIINNELAGNCRISISFGDEPCQNFMGATYMDSLSSPLTTTRPDALTELADEASRLFDIT